MSRRSSRCLAQVFGSAWRILADAGVRIVVCAVVSTNAPTVAFVERAATRHGSLGEVVVVCNNQDGSSEFPTEISKLPQRKIHLAQLQSGLQAVRLQRQERLSSVLNSPAAGYQLAGALMAMRILGFANQPVIRDFANAEALRRLSSLSAHAPRNLRYTITTKIHARDEKIRLNARLREAELALHNPELGDAAILDLAKKFRRQYAEYHALTNGK